MVRQIFCNFPTVHSVEKREIPSHQKNISSNQLFSNLIKNAWEKIRIISTLCIGKSEKFVSSFFEWKFEKKFRENNAGMKFFSKMGLEMAQNRIFRANLLKNGFSKF